MVISIKASAISKSVATLGSKAISSGAQINATSFGQHVFKAKQQFKTNTLQRGWEGKLQASHPTQTGKLTAIQTTQKNKSKPITLFSAGLNAAFGAIGMYGAARSLLMFPTLGTLPVMAPLRFAMGTDLLISGIRTMANNKPTYPLLQQWAYNYAMRKNPKDKASAGLLGGMANTVETSSSALYIAQALIGRSGRVGTQIMGGEYIIAAQLAFGIPWGSIGMYLGDKIESKLN